MRTNEPGSRDKRPDSSEADKQSNRVREAATAMPGKVLDRRAASRLSPRHVLALQAAAGNVAMQRLLAPTVARRAGTGGLLHDSPGPASAEQMESGEFLSELRAALLAAAGQALEGGSL